MFKKLIFLVLLGALLFIFLKHQSSETNLTRPQSIYRYNSPKTSQDTQSIFSIDRFDYIVRADQQVYAPTGNILLGPFYGVYLSSTLTEDQVNSLQPVRQYDQDGFKIEILVDNDSTFTIDPAGLFELLKANFKPPLIFKFILINNPAAKNCYTFSVTGGFVVKINFGYKAVRDYYAGHDDTWIWNQTVMHEIGHDYDFFTNAYQAGMDGEFSADSHSLKWMSQNFHVLKNRF